jgi:four helix bundle protein
MDNNERRIRSFHDLDVYRSTYDASIIVLTKIIPNLPKEERFDLADQLRRSVKAVPRLIAEAYSKRHQKRGFQGLIDDAMEESNETIVSLSHVKDAYKIEIELCIKLIDVYDKASRQLYKLGLAWSNFKERRQTKPRHETDTWPKPQPQPIDEKPEVKYGDIAREKGL